MTRLGAAGAGLSSSSACCRFITWWWEAPSVHWTVLLFSPSSPRSVEKMKSNSFGKNEVLIYWLFLLEFDRIKELLSMMTEQLLCIAATTHKAIIS